MGNYTEVKGEEWGASCEPADREKTFKLIVTDFCAMRDGKEWDDGVPSAGYQLTEAGSGGEAGNSESFWMKYPMPFLTHWCAAREAQKEAAEAAEEDAWESADDEVAATYRPAKKKPRVFKYLKLHEETEVQSGGHGKRKRVYKCTVTDSITGQTCGAKCTAVDTDTGNLIKHFRRRAENKRRESGRI